jgi:hypothetical protein
MFLAVAPIDPKLKEMASSGLNKAEELATAIEGGKAVAAVAEAPSVSAAAEAVAEAVAEIKKEVEVVAEVKEKLETIVEVASEAVGTAVSQSVDADPSFGILIIAAPPPPVPSTPPEPPTLQVEEKVEKSSDVQDWGESK